MASISSEKPVPENDNMYGNGLFVNVGLAMGYLNIESRMILSSVYLVVYKPDAFQSCRKPLTTVMGILVSYVLSRPWDDT